jgi:hypothetical protein
MDLATAAALEKDEGGMMKDESKAPAALRQLDEAATAAAAEPLGGPFLSPAGIIPAMARIETDLHGARGMARALEQFELSQLLTRLIAAVKIVKESVQENQLYAVSRRAS